MIKYLNTQLPPTKLFIVFYSFKLLGYMFRPEVRSSSGQYITGDTRRKMPGMNNKNTSVTI
jgi:hypothetical protein